MMKTLIIYDEEGYFISSRSDIPEHREPTGIPFLWVDVPEGKRIKITDGIAVDVATTPHQVILEDIPPSETDILKQEVIDLQDALAEVAEMLAGVLG